MRETSSWLDQAPIEAFEAKLRELEAIVHPITAKLGGDSDNAASGSEHEAQPAAGPRVEEVD